jgi:hypothetical protein
MKAFTPSEEVRSRCHTPRVRRCLPRSWLAGRLAHLLPPRPPGLGGNSPLSLEVRLDAVAAVVLDGLSYRRVGRMVGISKTEVDESMDLLLGPLAALGYCQPDGSFITTLADLRQHLEEMARSGEAVCVDGLATRVQRPSGWANQKVLYDAKRHTRTAQGVAVSTIHGDLLWCEGGRPGSCHEQELLALSGLDQVPDAAGVATLLDRGFRGMAKPGEHWHAPVGDRRTKDRLTDRQRAFNRLQAGLRTLVEQSIAPAGQCLVAAPLARAAVPGCGMSTGPLAPFFAWAGGSTGQPREGHRGQQARCSSAFFKPACQPRSARRAKAPNTNPDTSAAANTAHGHHDAWSPRSQKLVANTAVNAAADARRSYKDRELRAPSAAPARPGRWPPDGAPAATPAGNPPVQRQRRPDALAPRPGRWRAAAPRPRSLRPATATTSTQTAGPHTTPAAAAAAAPAGARSCAACPPRNSRSRPSAPGRSGSWWWGSRCRRRCRRPW